MKNKYIKKKEGVERGRKFKGLICFDFRGLHTQSKVLHDYILVLCQ